MPHRLAFAQKLARDLFREAKEARALAATFSDGQTIKDLESFAHCLEVQAQELSGGCGTEKKAAR